MRIEQIEQSLQRLAAPDPPPDLKARCLATIPAASEARTTNRGRFWQMRGMRSATAVALSLVILAAVWSVRPQGSSGAAVWAATIEAMQDVSFFHSRGRGMGFSPHGGDDGKTWLTGRWVQSESWFDAEYGYYNESDGETFAFQRTLELPNGEHYARSDNGIRDYLKITSLGPARWERLRKGYVTQHLDLNRRARGFNHDAEPRLLSSKAGEWRDRPMTVITFEAPPSEENRAKGAPTVRTIFYIEPSTKLMMARQRFAVMPDGEESLIDEDEFDYAQRPDMSRFDPKRLIEGAQRVFRGEGKPGEDLNPPEL